MTASERGELAPSRTDYSYDLSGNRTEKTADTTSVSTYSTDPTSNRLLSQGGAQTVAYTYDPTGRLTGDGSFTHSYNATVRRIASTNTATGQTTTYGYNALGQRISKTSGGNTSQYVYDEQGHLIGEYDGSGHLLQEILWLGGLPVAVLKPSATATPDLYYIHAAHLGTPRKITRPGDNHVVWTWESEAFGASLPDPNPSGLGNFVFNLRFPGQYYDAETGLHYNVFRDYDPATGRYGESDPIGLAGGINTYGYVGNNPLSRTDLLGLTWTDNWNMFWAWAFGTAPTNTVYGPETNQSVDMMQSQGVQNAVQYFNQKNAGKCPDQWTPITGYGYKFGPQALWDAGTNSTQQFVGSYNVNIYPNSNGSLDVHVYNTTSMTSFFYGIYPNTFNPTNGWPMGNTSQEYTGQLPASTDATGCGCGTPNK